MPERVTIQRMRSHWADTLGCDPALLSAQGVVARQNAGRLADYRGVYLLRWEDTCVVSAPEPYVEDISAAVAGRSPDAVFDAGAVAVLVGAAAERIVGPATQACIDALDFQPADARGTRVLTAHDAAALRELAAACDPTEWDHSGIESDGTTLFGCFAGGQLAAAGMLRSDGSVRHIGIVTHPAFRRRGYGRAAVSSMTRAALDEGAIPHYQTLESNTPSRAIARTLGFAEYARTLAVRLLMRD